MPSRQVWYIQVDDLACPHPFPAKLLNKLDMVGTLKYNMNKLVIFEVYSIVHYSSGDQNSAWEFSVHGNLIPKRVAFVVGIQIVTAFPKPFYELHTLGLGLNKNEPFLIFGGSRN